MARRPNESFDAFAIERHAQIVMFATSNRKNGCNYTTEEGEAVALAYMKVRNDPIVEYDQRASRFYERICDMY